MLELTYLNVLCSVNSIVIIFFHRNDREQSKRENKTKYNNDKSINYDTIQYTVTAIYQTFLKTFLSGKLERIALEKIIL